MGGQAMLCPVIAGVFQGPEGNNRGPCPDLQWDKGIRLCTAGDQVSHKQLVYQYWQTSHGLRLPRENIKEVRQWAVPHQEYIFQLLHNFVTEVATRKSIFSLKTEPFCLWYEMFDVRRAWHYTG